MEWTDILFFLFLVALAGFIFYRAFRKKKWCPAIFGSADSEAKNSGEKEDGS